MIIYTDLLAALLIVVLLLASGLALSGVSEKYEQSLTNQREAITTLYGLFTAYAQVSYMPNLQATFTSHGINLTLSESGMVVTLGG